MIFAAGLGTRLRPLTNNKPKALVEVCGKTLLQHSIDMLTACGATHIIINVHHFADMIKEYIGRLQCPTDISISDESDLLLDTGGGLRKASRLFRGDEPIAIVNVDILTNIDLRQMLQQHIEQDNDATLALRQRHSSRQLLFDSQMRLKGWQNTNSGEQIIVDHCRRGQQQHEPAVGLPEEKEVEGDHPQEHRRPRPLLEEDIDQEKGAESRPETKTDEIHGTRQSLGGESRVTPWVLGVSCAGMSQRIGWAEESRSQVDTESAHML